MQRQVGFGELTDLDARGLGTIHDPTVEGPTPAVRTDQDQVLAAVEEVEREDAFESGPEPVLTGRRPG